MGNIKKRNITVDIIKTIAIFGVVMIHTVGIGSSIMSKSLIPDFSR